ncbi:MAG: N-acetyltransferase [Proteobacteria bacterium]|nr:N-acetyltransferase [Pseudomonadota bacterium]
MFSKNQRPRQKNQLSCGKALPIKNRLSIRQIKKQDTSVLFKWASDIETRNSSFNPSRITKYQHKKWFAKIFKERDRNPALICLKNGRSRVGVIRFTRLAKRKNYWEIHFTVAPRYRGQGFSKLMLESALGWFCQTKPEQFVHARVKALNHKSLNVLQSLGFKKEKSSKMPNGLIQLWLPSRQRNASRSL